MCADWNQLFLDPTKIIQDPDPLVQRFCDEIAGEARVLDFGCGAGRHLVYLARKGLRVFGGDIAPVGLDHSRQWLCAEGLKADLVRFAMVRLPFRDDSFDGIISINVLNHGTIAQTAAAIGEAHRLLKPGVPFFFILIGREDARCCDGDEIEPFTFILRQGIEAGVPHHYFTSEEIEKLARKFKRSDISERKRLYDDRDPVFGNDPRLRGRKDAYFQHWEVRCWK